MQNILHRKWDTNQLDTVAQEHQDKSDLENQQLISHLGTDTQN